MQFGLQQHSTQDKRKQKMLGRGWGHFIKIFEACDILLNLVCFEKKLKSKKAVICSHGCTSFEWF